MSSLKSSHSSQLWNVPNILTMSRIVLAFIMFAILPFGFYATSLVLFIVAALTDFVDGWWARKYDQKTQFGRIMDPFADKLLVCGTFIYFAAIPELHDVRLFGDSSSCACPFAKIPFGLATWMVVAIVLREMFVTMLRSMIEAGGGDFSAKWVGKWKTTLQCVALPLGFLYMIFLQRADAVSNGVSNDVPTILSAAFVLSLYAVVYLTLYSGWIYIRAAIQIERAAKSAAESSTDSSTDAPTDSKNNSLESDSNPDSKSKTE